MRVSNGIIDTLKIYSTSVLTKNKIYWKIKISIMHAIVITTYLTTTLWDWFIKEALALWFMLIHLFLPGIENITYFFTISLSIWDLTTVPTGIVS